MRAYRPVVYTSFLLPDDDERAYADIIRENISLDISSWNVRGMI